MFTFLFPFRVLLVSSISSLSAPRYPLPLLIHTHTPRLTLLHTTFTKILSYLMGHNVSSVHGVKSSDFYAPGNAVNEIWVDNVELISRLPFGDSDLGQAGWPLGDWPKIPWHQFLIPLKRDLGAFQNTTMDTSVITPCVTPCVTPLIFGVDSEWASPLFPFSVLLIEFGFGLVFLIAVMVMDGLQTLRGWADCPLRAIPQHHKLQTVVGWAWGYFQLSFYYLLLAIFLMSFGFLMAVSAAPCIEPIEVFRDIMFLQGFMMLPIVLFMICLGCFSKKAVKRRHGDEQCQAAEIWLVQCQFNQPNIPAPPADQSTNVSVDVEKAMGSNSLE